VIKAASVPAGSGFPLKGTVTVEAMGSGMMKRIQVGLNGPITPFELDVGEGGPPRFFSVRLDPEELFPLSGPDEVVLFGIELVASEPVQGAQGVAFGGRRVVIEFDQPMAEISWESYKKQCPLLPEGTLMPALLDLEYEKNGHRLVFKTCPLIPSRTYLLPLQGVLRGADGSPVSTRELRFTTRSSMDKTPPRIVAAVPAPDAGNVPPDLKEIRATFNETMQQCIAFKTSDKRANQARGYAYPDFKIIGWNEEYTVLALEVEHLDPSTVYALSFRKFLDLSGNLVEPFDLIFTTAGK
jgi:hypothetical protein